MTESAHPDLRVLMVEPTGRGSHHRYGINLCAGLLDLGIKVRLLTSAPESPVPFLPRLLPMRDNILFHIPLMGAILRKTDRALRLLVNHRHLLKQIRSRAYNLVHLQVLNAVFLSSIARACRRAGAKLVVTRHNVRSHDHHKHIWNGINQRCFRKSRDAVDAFVAHTDFHRRGLEADGIVPERIHVIAYGPHPETGRRENSEREPSSVLMAGGLRANKGLDTLLRALEILDSRLDSSRLFPTVRIVGHAPRRSLARRIRTTAGKLRRIQLEHVNQYLPDPAYRRFFERSLVLVLPYSSEFSSLSAVLLDGYLHDNELVVTNAGANGEVVQKDETGEVVPADNPAALAEALHKTLERGRDPGRSANRSRALATRFNWTWASRETRNLYLSMVS